MHVSQVPSQSRTVSAGATIAALFTVPKKQQKPGKGGAQQPPSSAAKPAAEPSTPPFPPSHYLLSVDEMKCNSYPLPVADGEGTMVCPEGYVATQPAGEPACRAGKGCLSATAAPACLQQAPWQRRCSDAGASLCKLCRKRSLRKISWHAALRLV